MEDVSGRLRSVTVAPWYTRATMAGVEATATTATRGDATGDIEGDGRGEAASCQATVAAASGNQIR